MGEITKETFLRDVQDHKMTILHEDGLYRHLRFSHPSNSFYSFEISTFPGYLCYVGDMGEYVFHRYGSDDMLIFFHTDDLLINPSYWSEKCEAGEIKKWSQDKFRENVKHWTQDWDFEKEEGRSIFTLREKVDFILSADDEWESVGAIRDFTHPRYDFSDFWEYKNEEYTSRFIWCLLALTWAGSLYFGEDKS